MFFYPILIGVLVTTVQSFFGQQQQQQQQTFYYDYQIPRCLNTESISYATSRWQIVKDVKWRQSRDQERLVPVLCRNRLTRFSLCGSFWGEVVEKEEEDNNSEGRSVLNLNIGHYVKGSRVLKGEDD